MVNKVTEGVYGRGWAFPPHFNVNLNDSEGGGVAMVHDIEDIRQSLLILFSTQPYERIMREDYGCDLQSAVFENINDDLIADITSKITDGILRYEKRVTLVALDITQDKKRPYVLRILLTYRVRGMETEERLGGQLDIGEGQRRGFFL
ncbi:MULTISPECIES: GPW/gp25 family protein [unclassified Burkholderia]|uniref:GPW/gp25 family protein n=1 Tax=unclassified Burkholderia TaxID=2613784 RepID=UPI0009EA0517|nr:MULTISPECIES: GPW/gp25 family protein [unclassified Burkholderia]